MIKSKTINAGPIGAKPKGNYSEGEYYTYLDCVKHSHDSWVCKALDAQGLPIKIKGQEPSDNSPYWQALTDGGRAAFAEGTQVRTEFNTWFGATADSGIRRTVAEWLTSVQTSFNNWFSDTLSTGVRKIWSTWFGNVQSSWTTLSGNVSDAVGRANTASAHSEDLNAHPAYIADGTTSKPGDANYWYIWNHAQMQYVRAAYAKGDDLDWNDMSQADKDALAQLVLNTMTMASVETCEAIVDELT